MIQDSLQLFKKILSEMYEMIDELALKQKKTRHSESRPMYMQMSCNVRRK